VDVRPVRLEPSRVSIAQLALLQGPALAIGVPGEPAGSDAAARTVHCAESAYLPNTDVTSSVSRYSVSSCTLPLAIRKI
jgi:hypothetical protein